MAKKQTTHPIKARASVRRVVVHAASDWWHNTADPWLREVWRVAAPAWKPARAVLVCVTPLGWTVVGLGLISLALAHWPGWREFSVVALACLVFFATATLFAIGRMHLAVTLEVTPQRVVVGQPSMARFEITNIASSPLLALGVELPVGVSSARYTSPVLGPGATYEDWVTIPTSQRGVVRVGPILTQRGDPFGMVRRELRWTDSVDLYIHPKIVMLDELGTGLLRDLEGQTTQDISASDLAFHALRDYIPGDDQRYIHWKSSARLSSVSGEQKFLVRQFLDTRRSHIAIITDVNADAYTCDEEFELALSCGASVAVRAITDEMGLSIVCGSLQQTRPAPHVALDTYSQAVQQDVTLADAVRRLGDTTADASMMVLVTGPNTQFRELQLARSLVSMQVRMVVVRVSLGAAIAMRETSGFAEVRIGDLPDLPRALLAGVNA